MAKEGNISPFYSEDMGLEARVLMGEVSMGLTGDEDMTIVPSVLQVLFCFFSLHTNWSMKEVERDTSHKQSPGRTWARAQLSRWGRQSVPIFLSLLCPINSFSAENEDKSLHSRNLRAASPSFCGAECWHHRWPTICHLPSAITL